MGFLSDLWESLTGKESEPTPLYYQQQQLTSALVGTYGPHMKELAEQALAGQVPMEYFMQFFGGVTPEEEMAAYTGEMEKAFGPKEAKGITPESKYAKLLGQYEKRTGGVEAPGAKTDLDIINRKRNLAEMIKQRSVRERQAQAARNYLNFVTKGTSSVFGAGKGALSEGMLYSPGSAGWGSGLMKTLAGFAKAFGPEEKGEKSTLGDLFSYAGDLFGKG